MAPKRKSPSIVNDMIVALGDAASGDAVGKTKPKLTVMQKAILGKPATYGITTNPAVVLVDDGCKRERRDRNRNHHFTKQFAEMPAYAQEMYDQASCSGKTAIFNMVMCDELHCNTMARCALWLDVI